MDLQVAREKRLFQLNELDEFQNDAYANAKIYKDKHGMTSISFGRNSN